MVAARRWRWVGMYHRMAESVSPPPRALGEEARYARISEPRVHSDLLEIPTSSAPEAPPLTHDVPRTNFGFP